ncbi:3D domain-containing protein [Halobacillus salinarum]|uniref:3D domain-containing protein n=1 Tax=Halobacillus salinarum TaxID=2932257 RepID=A0ABY4EMF0_9BACI|nr:3D domain-containing protein [Halobacillus salinarum]UOQ43286.1 3D domain-containing protein [Halobacillus salinarum]
MKKSSILFFTLLFYIAGVFGHGSQQNSTVSAVELAESDQTPIAIQKMDVKSLKLAKRKEEHKRFEEKKKKAAKKTENNNEVKRTVNVEATAYTAFCEGCSGTTYTGINLRKNPKQKVIAVDPDVIPLGSKVRVPGYGVAIAGDIGSDIQGHRIDCFIPKHGNAMKFGRRQVKVEILES